ncbi:MAG: NifU family protein [Actinomycetota bacterium]|nr:NifU family protein [Actinomycetota bacterium]MEE3212286.1 NifU family protein [Actinomycetota bacterium]MEE3250787.1 NifU family protein [Actinomycetota bacterium]MEE3275292.1 NifU family protein [Actinomycetota bacterium]|tara:strand:- start:300 stop:602 length:303 start_codon:yes stop_codon:yes gene_type:complete
MSIDVATDQSAGDLLQRVEKVIDIIRPAIQADDGDIVLHGVDEATGEVTVELVGACVSCPASDQTLKAGIERIMKDRVPGVTAVLNVGETVEASGTAVSL